jgi:hypothetical protein
MLQTLGISPKVKVPAWALTGIGVVLVVASYAIDGLEPVREEGYTLIGSGPLAAVLGYKASPGVVVPAEPLDPPPMR